MVAGFHPILVPFLSLVNMEKFLSLGFGLIMTVVSPLQPPFPKKEQQIVATKLKSEAFVLLLPRSLAATILELLYSALHASLLHSEV